jgi:hypothetical protein
VSVVAGLACTGTKLRAQLKVRGIFGEDEKAADGVDLPIYSHVSVYETKAPCDAFVFSHGRMMAAYRSPSRPGIVFTATAPTTMNAATANNPPAPLWSSFVADKP